MKTTTFAVMTLMLAAFIILFVKITSFSIYYEVGLLNPFFHFQVLSGMQVYLIIGLLAVAYGVYTHWIVEQLNQNLMTIRQLLSQPVEIVEETQPVRVKTLKTAIRSSDVQTVREFAMDGNTMAYADERFLTPLELAEIYGNESIIAIIKEALEWREKCLVSK
jgi:magnesium-transporting ATPase (P-type)